MTSSKPSLQNQTWTIPFAKQVFPWLHNSPYPQRILCLFTRVRVGNPTGGIHIYPTFRFIPCLFRNIYALNAHFKGHLIDNSEDGINSEPESTPPPQVLICQDSVFFQFHLLSRYLALPWLANWSQWLIPMFLGIAEEEINRSGHGSQMLLVKNRLKLGFYEPTINLG